MKQTTAGELEKQLTEGKAISVIDVREAYEVAMGKIPGAVNIPLGLLEHRMNELDKNAEYILVCASGARSAHATMFLDRMGYNVTNMMGGMMSWFGNIE